MFGFRRVTWSFSFHRLWTRNACEVGLEGLRIVDQLGTTDRTQPRFVKSDYVPGAALSTIDLIGRGNRPCHTPVSRATPFVIPPLPPYVRAESAGRCDDPEHRQMRPMKERPTVAEGRATRRGRLVRLAVCAAGVALGWAAASAALGLGAPAAHAADDDDRAVLGTVFDVVDDVVDVLPDDTAEPLTDVVSTVERQTTKTVRAATTTVKAVTATKPISKATSAVTKTVAKVPVVNRVAEESGLSETIDRTGDALSSVVDRVVDVTDAVASAATPPATEQADLPDSSEPLNPPLVPSAAPGEGADDRRAHSASPPDARAGGSATPRYAADAPPSASAAAVGPWTVDVAADAASSAPGEHPGWPSAPPAPGGSTAASASIAFGAGIAATLSHGAAHVDARARSALPASDRVPGSCTHSPDTPPD